MKTKKEYLEFLTDISGITLGTILCGLGYSLFLIPFKASPGGVGGLSQIMFYIFHIPAGLAMLLFNIPLFIIGILTFGKTFGLKTIIAIFLTSFFTDLFSPQILIKFHSIQPFLYKINDVAYSFTDEYLLAVLAGSLIVGAGFGIVIKFNGSTGGTDIPALLLRKHFGLSIGNGYLIIDTMVIFLIGIVFKEGNLILWGLLSLFISSKACDFVIEGQSYTKGVFIMTQKPDLIKKYIIADLERGCTIFRGEGAYSGDDKEILYTVIGRRQLSKLKHNIYHLDNSAFVTVSNVHEALGKGFRKF